jgi:large subunit ribosomal protein L23
VKNPRDVIIGPIVSEKSYDLIEQRGTYTFQVDPRSNRSEVKIAVESIFGVKVDRVNIINRKGKRKRTGFAIGKRNDTKRALVTLAEGNEIDIFGVK